MRFYRNMAEHAATHRRLHHQEVMVRLNRIQDNVNILLDIIRTEQLKEMNEKMDKAIDHVEKRS